MNTFVQVAEWLANNLFGQPVILIGLIVLLGLVLQKKNASQTMSGTFKAMIGFLIINIGAGTITAALEVFQPMWAAVFGLEQQSLGEYQGFEAFSSRYGGVIALAMTLGFLINVLLARITPFKYIYLTGHMMFWTTAIFAGIMVDTLGVDIEINRWILILILAVIMGVYWTLQPAITQPFMRKVIGSNDLALGHTSGSVALLGGLAGKWFGNKENDTEKLKVPKGMEFLKDSNVIIALVMGALYVVGAALLMLSGAPGAAELMASAGDNNFIVFSIIKAFEFAAGIAVVLFGVRMLIGELVPAFRGIATKIVPNAKPALDAPVVFPYAPTATIVGFVSAFAASLIWLVVLGAAVSYVFVPTMIVIFFHAATAGVFGNATGGVRGAIFGGVITATVVAWGQYIMVTALLSSTIPDTAMWAADSDMFILGPVIKLLANIFRFLL